MQLKKTRFSWLIFSFLKLGFCAITFGQPHQWQVTDLKGKIKFSVSADTIYSLLPDVFVSVLGNESTLFKSDPFFPSSKEVDVQYLPMNKEFYSVRRGNISQLISVQSGAKPLNYFFLELGVWSGKILGRTEKGWVFRPGEPEELWGDSIRKTREVLLLFQKEGMIELDSTLKARFHRVSAPNRKFNPFHTFILQDSLWFSTTNSEVKFVSKNGGFWWNDSLYLDSSSEGVFIQRPGKARKLLADSIVVVSKEFCYLKQKKGFSLLSFENKKIKVPRSDLIRLLHDSLIGLKANNQWFIYSRFGNQMVVNKAVSDLKIMKEGMIPAKAGKRYGFVDPMGFIRIACRYDSLLPFHQGLAAARVDNFWGFLDKDERLKIQPNYQKILSFQAPFTAVKKEGKWGIINLEGVLCQPLIFDSITIGTLSGWKTTKSGWTGWLNINGKILVANRYSNIIEPCLGFLEVWREGKRGLFSIEGLQIFPVQFQKIYIDLETQNIFAH